MSVQEVYITNKYRAMKQTVNLKGRSIIQAHVSTVDVVVELHTFIPLITPISSGAGNPIKLFFVMAITFMHKQRLNLEKIIFRYTS